MRAKPPPGVRLISVSDDGRTLVLELCGAPGTLYAGERWLLQMVLDKYPFESPSTTFMGQHVPTHHHVYRYAVAVSGRGRVRGRA